MYGFENQTAVITGGTRGIGRATAEAFLNAGASVFCLYGRDESAAEKLRSDHRGRLETGRLKVERLDVAEAESCLAFWRRLEAEGVVPEILVNGAGIRRDAALALMPAADWKKVLDVNLGGVFNMTKPAVQAMSGRRYGRIVNISSPGGRIGFEGQANYAASKAGMEALAKSLARETGRRGITVNCVSPGFIDTDFIRDLPAGQVEGYKKTIPLRRFGRPEEVAEAVLFLASREASYITGAILEVAGGL
jgi:3-oxoacyl-[acyl-carrier protein] reductase